MRSKEQTSMANRSKRCSQLLMIKPRQHCEITEADIITIPYFGKYYRRTAVDNRLELSRMPSIVHLEVLMPSKKSLAMLQPVGLGQAGHGCAYTREVK